MDISAVLNTVRVVANEFETVDDATITQWLMLTEPFVSRRRFGRFWAQALALLTSHRMNLAEVGASSGSDALLPISGLGTGGLMRIGNYSEGDASIAFNQSVTQYTDKDADLSLTQYGIQYLSILRMIIVPITSAGENYGGT